MFEKIMKNIKVDFMKDGVNDLNEVNKLIIFGFDEDGFAVDLVKQSSFSLEDWSEGSLGESLGWGTLSPSVLSAEEVKELRKEIDDWMEVIIYDKKDELYQKFIHS